MWIDDQNHVHLKVANSPSGWSCAELYTNVKFGFGTYRWFVEGAIDKFDRNMVLGFFTYGSLDRTNEIDIEVALWGRTEVQASNFFYTVFPNELNVGPVSKGKRIALNDGTYTTHQFTWTRDHVSFRSQYGFKTSPTEDVFFTYQTPASFTPHMPVLSVPLHMNLWIFNGGVPTDNKEVEIVVHGFQYTPDASTFFEEFSTTEDPWSIEKHQTTGDYSTTEERVTPDYPSTTVQPSYTEYREYLLTTGQPLTIEEASAKD